MSVGFLSKHSKSQITSNIFSTLQELFPFNYSVCCDTSYEAIDVFLSKLPFEISSYPSTEVLRGWTIPSGWHVNNAQIFHNGKMIYDCIAYTKLGCAYLSPSFYGTVSKDDLLAHCTYRQDLPQAVVYDWSRLYRQGVLSWGLSIPWEVLNSLPNDNLVISLDTSFYPSSMKVLEYKLQGKTNNEIIINAHNCHPFQANDDISGCAVAIEFFRLLRSLPKLEYSYRLLICPELFGPMFWLDANFRESNPPSGVILLKSIGNNSSLKLQSSFDGNSMIDCVMSKAIEDVCTDHILKHGFRTYYGNDETVFESPGFEIPSITLTRYPFPEYHTNLDIPGIICEEKLFEVFSILYRAVEILETNHLYDSPPNGLYCLSNPIYDLYRTAVEPGISMAGESDIEKRWNLMMNCLPRLLARGTTPLELANTYELDYDMVIGYLHQWVDKGLAKVRKL